MAGSVVDQFLGCSIGCVTVAIARRHQRAFDGVHGQSGGAHSRAVLPLGNGNGPPRAVEGAPCRAPKTIAQLLACAYPSTCGSTTAPSLLPTGRNEAVEHFNGARERVLSTRTPCLLGLVSPSSVASPSSRPVCPWRACTCLAGRGLGSDRFLELPPLLGDRRPLAKLLTLPVERAVEPAPVPRVHQLSQRLSEETVAALVSDYRSGASLDDLQRSYLLRPVAPDFEGSCTAWAG